jgi:predicted porin
MSFQYSWSVVRSQITSKSFSRNSLAVAVGLVLSSQALAGFPTLYGKIHLTLNQYDLEKIDFAPATSGFAFAGGTDTTTELDTVALESTGSRLGIQGDFDASANVTVFYRLEYGIDVDNGTNSNGRELSQRNIFGGLRGDWGSVLVGKNDTPLKTLQTNTVLRTDVDRFNDSPLGDIGTYIVGENRPDNVIQYTSPILLGGLEVNIAAIQAEETGVATTTSKQDDNGFATGKSVSVTYGKAKWYVGVGVDSNVATTDAVRAVGEYTFGPVKVGAIYQTAEAHEEGVDSLGGFSTFVGTNGTLQGAQYGLNPLSEWDGASAANAYKEQDGFIVNAQWKIAGPWLAKIQYASSSTTPNNEAYSDTELDGIIVGLDYNFNPNARLFATYAQVEVDGDEAISTVSTTDTAAALGFDFRF